MKKRLNTLELPASKGCGGKEVKAKVGDLVRWLHDEPTWVAFGTVVEIDANRGCYGAQFRVVWHNDYEDVVGYEGMWYDPIDWEESMEKV